MKRRPYTTCCFTARWNFHSQFKIPFNIFLQNDHEGKDSVYRNFPKFLDRQVWANSADPDQTAPRGAVWSGSTLFAIPSASFRLITLW